ncbi:hypothetical protein [Erysipelatoclostridium sp. DFI.2.3]|nr:hypothetical protein [Erysipelatoclostridium sp. DFI.2.3]
MEQPYEALITNQKGVRDMRIAKRAELLKKWEQEHKSFRSELAERIGITPVSINNYLKIYTGTIKQKEFWKVAGEMMGVDFEAETEKPRKYEKVVLPPYVATTLKSKGRTVIERKYISRYGKKRILNYLAKQGLKCRFVLAGTENDPTDILEIVK